MNVTKNVEEILYLTLLHRVFEYCSVQDLFCLLHRAASMPSCSAHQSHRPGEDDCHNSSVKWQQALVLVSEALE